MAQVRQHRRAIRILRRRLQQVRRGESLRTSFCAWSSVFFAAAALVAFGVGRFWQERTELGQRFLARWHQHALETAASLDTFYESWQRVIVGDQDLAASPPVWRRSMAGLLEPGRLSQIALQRKDRCEVVEGVHLGGPGSVRLPCQGERRDGFAVRRSWDHRQWWVHLETQCDGAWRAADPLLGRVWQRFHLEESVRGDTDRGVVFTSEELARWPGQEVAQIRSSFVPAWWIAPRRAPYAAALVRLSYGLALLSWAMLGLLGWRWRARARTSERSLAEAWQQVTEWNAQVFAQPTRPRRLRVAMCGLWQHQSEAHAKTTAQLHADLDGARQQVARLETGAVLANEMAQKYWGAAAAAELQRALLKARPEPAEHVRSEGWHLLGSLMTQRQRVAKLWSEAVSCHGARRGLRQLAERPAPVSGYAHYLEFVLAKQTELDAKLATTYAEVHDHRERAREATQARSRYERWVGDLSEVATDPTRWEARRILVWLVQGLELLGVGSSLELGPQAQRLGPGSRVALLLGVLRWAASPQRCFEVYCGRADAQAWARGQQVTGPSCVVPCLAELWGEFAEPRAQWRERLTGEGGCALVLGEEQHLATDCRQLQVFNGERSKPDWTRGD